MRRALIAFPFLAAVATLHCGDDDTPATPGPVADGGSGADAAEPPEADKPLVPASKVDVLFVVDNSASMLAKQKYLAISVGGLLRRLAEPPGKDVHVGVVSTSLGASGTDTCPKDRPRTNDLGRLRNRDKADAVIPGAESGFISFGAPGALIDIATVEQRVATMIEGVGESGCGFEAQLETMYRFLSAPDPWESIAIDEATSRASYVGIDFTLLAQRKAFLRPDSAVVVIMLTDEDDSNVDPLARGGTGWQYAARRFPKSAVMRGTAAQGTTAPRGTSICERDPASPDCRSCAECAEDPACTSKQDPSCTKRPEGTQGGPGIDGYLGPQEDDLNIRFWDMKRRFGVDPQYPIDRYVKGLTSRKVPDRAREHGASGVYEHARVCTNPLFAAELRDKPGDDLCNLPEGGRSRQLVFFQLIGGVPKELLAPAPDWTKILGANPAAYDRAGSDPHMVPSAAPRPGLSGADLPRGNNGTDPIHGREWNTQGKDLQFACTFPLAQPVLCTSTAEACDCRADFGQGPVNVPLCDGSSPDLQTRAKAYPSIRELRFAKELGDRAAVASICDLENATYTRHLDALATKMAPALAK